MMAADDTLDKNHFGLFAPDHCPYKTDRNIQDDPSLVEMTMKALDILENAEDGYFLFVEGGRIDHAHHDQLAVKAIEEFVEFDDAIEQILERVDLSETLVIVTADHSHSMSMVGYDGRNTSVFDNIQLPTPGQGV